MTNKDIYQSQKIVKGYVQLNELFKPEKTVLRILKNKLKNMRMLDIGVGGGRTTHFFSPLVKQYLGIDYSEQMLNACKKRFLKHSDNISFKLCDVRTMKIIKSNYFDFILASSNGLDYMPHNDRLKALKEIKRVGKKGGYFFFSAHNLLGIDRLLEVKLSLNPIKMSKNLIAYVLLKILNKDFNKLKQEKYTFINDGAHQFRLSTYYIMPMEQIKQLENIGFRNVRVFSLETGNEITKKSDIYKTQDGLYHGLSYLSNF